MCVTVAMFHLRDFSPRRPGPSAIARELAMKEINLKAKAIVIVRTGRARYYFRARYYCGAYPVWDQVGTLSKARKSKRPLFHH
jgi:hypothetical protein